MTARRISRRRHRRISRPHQWRMFRKRATTYPTERWCYQFPEFVTGGVALLDLCDRRGSRFGLRILAGVCRTTPAGARRLLTVARQHRCGPDCRPENRWPNKVRVLIRRLLALHLCLGEEGSWP